MRALIYTRTSTRDQELGHSAQESHCREYARAHGLTVTGVFKDHVSGSVEPGKRDGFNRLLDALGEGDVLLTLKRDRLGRDVVQNAVAESLVHRKGARVVTLDCSSGDDPSAVFMRLVIDAVAQYERALIQQRTRAALAEKRARGEVCGVPARGYRKDEQGRAVIDEKECEMIERVRAWRSEGRTLAQIQTLCEREGVTARSGRAPSLGTLSLWTRGVQMKHKPHRPKRTVTGPSRARVEDNVVGLRAVVHDLHARGLSQRAIVTELGVRGYRTRNGRPYTKTQVWRILARSPHV